MRLGEDFNAEFDGETAKLIIRRVYSEDEGEYTCVAYNELGKAFTSAVLIVDGKTIVYLIQVVNIHFIWHLVLGRNCSLRLENIRPVFQPYSNFRALLCSIRGSPRKSLNNRNFITLLLKYRCLSTLCCLYYYCCPCNTLTWFT